MAFVYVKDCAKAISLVHLAPSLKHDIYNISDGEPHRLNDFRDAITELIPQAQIALGEVRVPDEKPDEATSIERIKEDVGFAPDYYLKRAVKAYIDWLRDGKYS